MKPSDDLEAISLIIDGLIKRGCKPTVARNGADDDLPYTDKESAIDWLTSCDESILFVDVPHDGHGWIYFVLGNSPEEVVCDHTVNLEEYIDPIVMPWWD